MCFHKRHDLRRVGSASWAKNELANRRISLVRFSSVFSLRSRFSSSKNAGGFPRRFADGRSRRRSPCWSTGHPAQPVGLALAHPLAERLGTDPQLAGHISDRATLRDRYKSIARALNSGANLLGLVTIQLLPWPNQTKIESLQETLIHRHGLATRASGLVGDGQGVRKSVLRQRIRGSCLSSRRTLAT